MDMSWSEQKPDYSMEIPSRRSQSSPNRACKCGRNLSDRFQSDTDFSRSQPGTSSRVSLSSFRVASTEELGHDSGQSNSATAANNSLRNSTQSKVCENMVDTGSPVHILGETQTMKCSIEVEPENKSSSVRRYQRCSSIWWKQEGLRIVLGFLLVGIVVFLIVDFSCCGNSKMAMNSILDFVENNGILGSLVFILIFVLATVLLFPPVILTYSAGLTFSMCYGIFWGTAFGTLIVIVGAIIGSSVAFLLGRYVIQDSVSKWCKKYKTLHAIDIAVASEGFKVSALLRISPLIPFGVLNYLFAVTRITFKDFFCGTVGIVPGTIAFVFFGALSGDALQNEDGVSTTNIVIYVVGGVATLVAIVIIVVHTKKVLKKTLKDAEDNELDAAATVRSSSEVCEDCQPYYTMKSPSQPTSETRVPP